VDQLTELLGGRFRDPDTGEPLRVPVKSVVIAPTLAGAEADHVEALGLEPPYAVVSDSNTHAALGARVETALARLGKTIPIHLPSRPHADERTAATILSVGEAASAYIAVGSGTINDLVKYAAARLGKRCAVFATAPSMNGYTSLNAALTIKGHKKTLPAVAPEGVFIDLDVMARAPARLIAAGFGDAICRSTAETDWLMAHRLLGRPYRRAAYALLGDLENEMVERAAGLATGERTSVACLTRVLILSGFGMTIAGSSAPASQGEHLISHHLEMMPPEEWCAPFHGEQIAVTTLVMAKLQERVLQRREAPRLAASQLTEDELVAHFGAEVGAACWQEIQPKLLDGERAEELNDTVAKAWLPLRDELRATMRPASSIAAVLAAAGAPRTYAELGLKRCVFSSAVRYARAIRDRYTFLDLAADSGLLDIERMLA
jgi:glycerol-1-phosphate dehydrogenase [NAD(P)+]